ncbi:MAG: ABC transporter permease [Bacteroidetes bacterium]|nr:ABC transporter permease [Bacteroidota bacterium]
MKFIQLIAYFFTNELKAIFKDAGAVLIFMIALVIYPLLYSIAYENEVVSDIPIAVVDLDHSAMSRKIGKMADATEQLKLAYKPASLKEAEKLFYQGNVKGVLLIPVHFEKDILSGQQTNLVVYSDASYFLLYKQVYAGAIYAVNTLGAGIEINKLMTEGKSFDQAIEQQNPLNVEVKNLYNPSSGYGSFVLPGIIILILQQTLLIGIGMMGGTQREKNIFHTIHAKVSEKWGSIPVILGKSFAYTLIYIFNAIFTMVILHHWFSLPDNGSILNIFMILIPYLLSVSFMGLAISVFFRERVYSLLFMVFLSPVVLFLSGLSWPAQTIPPFLYAIAHIFPSTTMIPVYIRMRICGASLDQVSAEWAFILIQMLIYFVLACISYKIAFRQFNKSTIK